MTMSSHQTPFPVAVKSSLRIRYRGYDLPLDRVLEIGRGPDCHLRIRGALVSRKHARVRPTKNGAVIEDAGSRNGVIVNNRKIECPTPLRHGDRVTIGLATLDVFAAGSSLSVNATTIPPEDVPIGLSDVDGLDELTEVARVDTLSKRERDVFELVARGHTQRKIGEMLHISAKTVESHRARIGTKLGCRTRAELVRYALAARLLEFPVPRLGLSEGDA